MRKILSSVLGAAMVIAVGAAAAVPAMAADPTIIPLQGSGNSFNEQWSNTFSVGDVTNASDPSIWHLVYSGQDISQVQSAHVAFTCGVLDWTPADQFSLNGGGNNPGWVIYAPGDCQILKAASYLVTTEDMQSQGNGKDITFNISGYHRGVPERAATGAIEASATMQNLVTVTTPWEERQLTLQPWWLKTVQPYKADQYAKPTKSVTDTLVTRLTYSDNTAKATPLNGGAFKNGQTYVKLDLAQASQPGGMKYPIADSSYNANGKKTPNEYNNPIGYEYRVTIASGKIVVGFDSTTLISASVGLYARCMSDSDLKNADKVFPGNAPAHYANTASVDVPTCTPAQSLYIFVHIESLKWYTSDKYQLVGSHTWTKEVSDAWSYDEQVGDKLLSAWDETSQEVSPYTGGWTLAITGSNGITRTLHNEWSLGDLEPGLYNVVLTADNDQFWTASDVRVEAGKTTEVDFGPVQVLGERVDPTQTRWAAPVYLLKKYLPTQTLPVIQGPDEYLN